MWGLYQMYRSLEIKLEPSFKVLEQAGLLFARLYVSWIFLKSGLLKIQSWETTLMLFEYEYSVPLLSPYWAAVLGTFGELVFPVLIIAGLFSRFSAVALLVVNVVAAISLAELSPAALLHHINWAVLLAFVIVRGAGVASLDYVLVYFKDRRQKPSELKKSHKSNTSAVVGV